MGRIYQNPNQILLEDLIPIYMPPDYIYCNYDWLYYLIKSGKKSKTGTLTIHHITKVADGGKTCKENAALLTKLAHQDLTTCESKDHILYDEINAYFREIIRMAQPPEEILIKEGRSYKLALDKALHPKRYR